MPFHSNLRKSAPPKPVKRKPRKPPTAEHLLATGWTPLAYMLSILSDEAETPANRKWAAEKAAPYVHPRFSAVAIADVPTKGADGEKLDTREVARKLMRVFEVAEQEPEAKTPLIEATAVEEPDASPPENDTPADPQPDAERPLAPQPKPTHDAAGHA